jgi:hypothetical protein
MLSCNPVRFSRAAVCNDRSSDVPFQTVLDRMLKYGQSHRDWRREAVALQRSDGTAMICRVIPVEGEARGGLDGRRLLLPGKLGQLASRQSQKRLVKGAIHEAGSELRS